MTRLFCENGKRFMENKKRKALRALVLAGMAVCLILIGRAYCQSARHEAQQGSLREALREKEEKAPASDVSEPNEISASVPESQSKSDAENQGKSSEESGGQLGEKPEMLERYAALYEENEELAGWISI